MPRRKSHAGPFSQGGLRVGGVVNNRAAPRSMTAQREHVRMKPAKPRATERSEGGSKRRARPKLLTEQLVIRMDKATMAELEQYAEALDRPIADVARRAIRKDMMAWRAGELD
jgi:hypothetical protein